jgi:hypothetical protein
VDPADTTKEARAFQLDAYRSMSGPERLRLGFALSEDVRRLADAGAAAREQHRTAT